MKFVEPPKSPILEMATTYITVEVLVFTLFVVWCVKLFKTT